MLDSKDPLQDFTEQSRDLLYHYTRADTALEKILYEGRIRFSPFRELDDPKENKDRRFVYKDIKPAIIDNEIDPELHINECVLDFSKVLCFCQDDFRTLNKETKNRFARGFARSRMWSQYAGRHTGTCLVFSRKSMDQVIWETFSDYYEIFNSEVAYQDSFPALTESRTLDGNELKRLGVKQYIMSLKMLPKEAF